MANSPGAGAVDDITLAELERLIKLLGMLGSGHDGEVVNAARLAVRWVIDHQTSWQVLLTPPEAPAVLGVGVGVSKGVDPVFLDQLEQAHAADRASAFKNGYEAGLRDMAQQVKAQAAMAAAGPVAPPAAPTGGWPAGSWQEVAQTLLDRHLAMPGVLRSREEAFVGDVLRRGFPRLTSAQETWLRDIAARNGLSW